MSDPETYQTPPEAPAFVPAMTVQINRYRSGGPAWLHLRGSLLLYEHSGVRTLSTTYVPVEKVEILAPRWRIRAWDALAWLLISGTGIGFAVAVAFVASGMHGLAAAIGWAAAVAFFAVPLVLAVRTLSRGWQTSRLRLGPEGPLVEFWHQPAKDILLDEFLQMLAYLQRVVAAPGRTFGWITRSMPALRFTVKRLVGLVFSFALGALLLMRYVRSPLVFLFVLVPIAAFLYERYKPSGDPREVVHARRHWAKGDDRKAQATLETVLAKRPSCIPAWRELVELHLSREEFDDAFSCCDAVQALGVLDPANADGVRGYVAMRKELSERWDGAGLPGVSMGEAGDSAAGPEAAPTEDNATKREQ